MYRLVFRQILDGSPIQISGALSCYSSFIFSILPCKFQLPQSSQTSISVSSTWKDHQSLYGFPLLVLCSVRCIQAESQGEQRTYFIYAPLSGIIILHCLLFKSESSCLMFFVQVFICLSHESNSYSSCLFTGGSRSLQQYLSTCVFEFV